MASEHILGVVMAGGASRRMGFDKRGLEFGGRSLLQRSASVLAAVCDEVVISVQPDAFPPDENLRAVPDLRPRCGPLSGLEAALTDAVGSGRSAFLLACDMPFAGVELVAHVLARGAASPESAAVVPRLGERRQPLCALYRKAALTQVGRQLDRGERSMAALLGRISCLDVDIGPELNFYRTDLFCNLNRPADLAAVAGLDR